jgi:hypothetical protein
VVYVHGGWIDKWWCQGQATRILGFQALTKRNLFPPPEYNLAQLLPGNDTNRRHRPQGTSTKFWMAILEPARARSEDGLITTVISSKRLPWAFAGIWKRSDSGTGGRLSAMC